MESFSELNLSAPVAQALAELGFLKPTPIQAKALPLLSEGPTDFLGMAATGTGKTAAFAIPLLERIDTTNKATQAIVLCPTRELAIQTSEQIAALGKHKRVQTTVIYGGTGYGDQIRGLRRSPHIIVATPGRLLDHLQQGNLSLGSVGTVVLDEADEMISMGFKEEIEILLKTLPEGACHTWLFAATMSPELRRVADTYLKNPKLAQINRTEMLSGTVRQVYYTVRDKNKPKALCKILDMAEDFYGLVFCQTKAIVTGVTEHLRERGYKVDSMHGDKSQMERERTLKAFKARQITVLICSDVAARGIDVKDLTHVINYSLPMELDSYVHRIGRTGRNGKTGLALNLVGPSHLHLVDRIQRRTKTTMEQGTLPTFDGIIGKRLLKLLEDVKKVQSHPTARRIIEKEWKTALEGMSQVDLAERLLLLAMPHLFDDREKAEEIEMTEDERKPAHPRFSRPHGGQGGGGGGAPGKAQWRNGRPFRRREDR